MAMLLPVASSWTRSRGTVSTMLTTPSTSSRLQEESEDAVQVPHHYDGDNQVCSLCCHPFLSEELCCRLPCLHVFHSTCYEQLLMHHKQQAPSARYPPCPNCRGAGRIVATWRHVAP
eukprot:4118244-Amphidinium_carterae.1